MSQCPVPAVPRPRPMPRPSIVINGPFGPVGQLPGGPPGSPPGPSPAYLQAREVVRRRLMHEPWIRA